MYVCRISNLSSVLEKYCPRGLKMDQESLYKNTLLEIKFLDQFSFSIKFSRVLSKLNQNSIKEDNLKYLDI